MHRAASWAGVLRTLTAAHWVVCFIVQSSASIAVTCRGSYSGQSQASITIGLNQNSSVARRDLASGFDHVVCIEAGATSDPLRPVVPQGTRRVSIRGI